MTRILAVFCMLTVVCVCILGNHASGADLRSTIDNRTFVRTVSASQPEEKAEAAASAQAAIAPQPRTQPQPPTSAVEELLEAGDCDSECCLEACCRPDLMWVGLDYLMWWRSGRRFPALVTGAPGPLPASPVLFGGEQISETAVPGGRVEFGHWFDANHRLGIGGRFVALGDARVDLALASSAAPGGLPFFARPFTLPGGVQNAQTIANEAITEPGTLNLRSGSDALAADVFARWLLRRNNWLRLDLVAGYQFARIDEDLVIDTFTNATAVPGIGANLFVHDQFMTQNEYHGGQFGLQGEYVLGNWTLELLTKFGFGSMRERVSIAGARQTVVPGPPPGIDTKPTSGFLAQGATNGGVHTQDEFSYMQDVGVKLGYCPGARLKLTVGYSLLYWSRLARPGDQIDTVIDPRLLAASVVPPAPAPTRPAFQFNSSGFLVHGLTFGLEYRF